MTGSFKQKALKREMLLNLLVNQPIVLTTRHQCPTVVHCLSVVVRAVGFKLMTVITM